MSKLRPTIRLSEWTIALDSEETNKIQNQKGVPGYNCQCDLCIDWRGYYKHLLPRELLKQLERTCINLNYPTEFYESHSDKSVKSLRAVFHFVGKILSGPESFCYNEKAECYIQDYQIIRDTPYFSLSVLKAMESYEQSPVREDGTFKDILCVDFRFEVSVGLM